MKDRRLVLFVHRFENERLSACEQWPFHRVRRLRIGDVRSLFDEVGRLIVVLERLIREERIVFEKMLFGRYGGQVPFDLDYRGRVVCKVGIGPAGRIYLCLCRFEGCVSFVVLQLVFFASGANQLQILPILTHVDERRGVFVRRRCIGLDGGRVQWSAGGAPWSCERILASNGVGRSRTGR